MATGRVVHTVCGPVAPEALGRTLMHEHVFCDFYRTTGDLNHLLNDERLACDELAALVRAGGTALVDCTTPDIGRNPVGLQRVAERTNLHIVMGTGWYRQPFYPPQVDRMSTLALADQMIRELTEGVDGIGIRAGIIGEIGAHLDYLAAQEERVLRAAARAHRATGAPITTHASMYPVGLAQLEVLREAGADPARVIVGHCDTYLDTDYHLAILRQGAYVQFDTVGRLHMNPDERRADALVALVRAGWATRLLLSSDRCHRSDLHAFGGGGYDIVFTKFFQLLRERGLSDGDLDLLTVENPRRALPW
ncbi:MAG: phosphotriesterase-related protein [Armatimonadota bacterium]|nr:phosphotriesterase-related protein [Armatimonadota bacterium]